MLGQVGRDGEWARGLFCFWCCCAEGLHGETGEVVSKNVIYTRNVGDANIVVASGSKGIEKANQLHHVVRL